MIYDYETNYDFWWDTFVPINNVDKSLSAIDRMIKDNRNKNNGKIDPELAYAILTYTNHCGHIKPIIKNIKEKTDKILIYEPMLDADEFEGVKVTKNLKDFKSKCSVIVANRVSPELDDVRDKVYTRDLFARD